MYYNIIPTSDKERRVIGMEPMFPGTVLERRGRTAEEFLSGLFFATRGIMLQQVREITGLETPVIQNWINRGWVGRPVEKRYSVNHLTRIMLINMLREVTSLENIANILEYINGTANCTDDDIIPEAKLYIYTCDLLDAIDYETVFDEAALDRKIAETIVDYVEPFPGAREKLMRGMKIILIYYASALVKVRADRLVRRYEIGK